MAGSTVVPGAKAILDDDDLETNTLLDVDKGPAPPSGLRACLASRSGRLACVVAVVLALLFVNAQAGYHRQRPHNRYLAERCSEILAAPTATTESIRAPCQVDVHGISAIASLLRNTWIHMVGESMGRDVYHELRAQQYGQPSPASKTGDHSPQRYRAGSGMTTFTWAPFLSDIVTTPIPSGTGVLPRPDFMYIAAGLHDVLYRANSTDDNVALFASDLKRRQASGANEFGTVIVELPPWIDRDRMSDPKKSFGHFANDRIESFRKALSDRLRSDAVSALVLSPASGGPFDDQADGIHSTSKTRQSTERLLQIIYWAKYDQMKAPLSTPLFALALLMIPVIVAAVWAQINAMSIEGQRLNHAVFTEHGVQAMTAAAVLTVVMLCVYLADGPTGFIPVTHKVRSYTIFAVSYAILFVGAVLFVRRVPDSLAGKRAILNRCQTEEWKGMMQVGFIWYHLFDAASTYNLIRVFVSSYVWMTGFGNFIFFQSKQDFSALRIVKTLFRLNFLVVLICITIGREWMLYYICPLHSFFFLVTWIVARIDATANKVVDRALIKIGLSAVVLAVLYEVPGLFDALFGLAGSIFMLNGSMYEWRFRCRLDGYATCIGMACALLLPTVSSKLLELDDSQAKGRTRRLAIVGASLAVLGAWFFWVYPMDKFLYNAINPFTSWLPILAYLFLRNAIPALRNVYLPLFQFIGTITLETYLLQLHLYMTHDAKMLLDFLPGMVIPNFVLSTALYMMASYVTFKATASINDFLFSPKGALATVKKRIAPLAAALTVGVMVDSLLVATFSLAGHE